MFEQFTHSVAAWLAFFFVLAIPGLLAMVKWKDRQVQRMKVKLVEQSEDASNERLEAKINAQRAKLGMDEKALQEAEARLSRALNTRRPGDGSK